jgi:hypothetical protein
MRMTQSARALIAVNILTLVSVVAVVGRFVIGALNVVVVSVIIALHQSG